MLQWDGSGLWILMKRLDCDSFHWPDSPDELQEATGTMSRKSTS
ncbi:MULTISPECIES: IS66 family insertion sequence element accessory protein TnpB [Blautia]